MTKKWREKLGQAWTWMRLARGFCRYCANYRNQDPERCDLHLAISKLEHAAAIRVQDGPCTCPPGSQSTHCQMAHHRAAARYLSRGEQ